uniref:Uncharacterized protein n=1 Tax=Palpitomonas bilix TaxID=652834 RepID=A0A7S3GM01_9EUKA|mmetsp:Transcript_9080/g.24687  ORF Transcript_9080/g.24687 Transcript_9080/m.24687 type:complete len:114 (+) Transcript_9080:269-610(+)
MLMLLAKYWLASIGVRRIAHGRKFFGMFLDNLFQIIGWSGPMHSNSVPSAGRMLEIFMKQVVQELPLTGASVLVGLATIIGGDVGWYAGMAHTALAVGGALTFAEGIFVLSNA